jgi:NADH dehydrogenase (ubiquinone) 1 alpha subcomplex subunit 2
LVSGAVDNHYYYRNFFEKNYSNLKHLNPGFPFLMRTGDASPAKFIATYDFGAQTERDLTNLSEKAVEQTLKELVQIGQVALKADMYHFQQSAPADHDIVDFAEIKRRH